MADHIRTSWDNMSSQEKIDAFNAQIDNSVVQHGQMLRNRTDIDPIEKMEMQAEMTEKANQAKAEFAQQVQAQEAAQNSGQQGQESGQGSEAGNQGGQTGNQGGQTGGQGGQSGPGMDGGGQGVGE